MTAPFKRIDAVVTLHTAHGRFTLTVENSPGPQAPELLGEYLATAVQRQYDEVRAVPAPKPPSVAEVEALRAEVIDLNRKLASKPPPPYSSIDAAAPQPRGDTAPSDRKHTDTKAHTHESPRSRGRRGRG